MWPCIFKEESNIDFDGHVAAAGCINVNILFQNCKMNEKPGDLTSRTKLSFFHEAQIWGSRL